jgi:peroxiredoxin
MKRGGLLAFLVGTFMFFFLAEHVVIAKELKHSEDAAKQLEIIRKKLASLPEMKVKDAKKYYEESLKELQSLLNKYEGTQQALEAKFYIGAVHYQTFNFDEALKCFNEVLSQDTIDINFKARTYYFKAKAFVGKGDITSAKESVAELRLIEPRAADSFGTELSGLIRVGMEAPTFTAADFKGNMIDLSKYKGNMAIIVFWSTWCEPCVQEFPKIQQLYQTFKEKGVQFIGISLDDDIGDLKGFVEQEKIPWPQIFDGKRWKGTLPSLYHIQAIPTLFVLDREHKVRYIGNDTESINRIVTTLLSESAEAPLFR